METPPVIKIIEEQSCKRLLHLSITYNNEDYFFIVKTLLISGKHMITEIRRGITSWDCDKKLKRSEKTKIKKLIKTQLLAYIPKHTPCHFNNHKS